MDDLIKRLRDLKFVPWGNYQDAVDAANALERLTARVVELEAERNLILAALPDDYTESKDWAFDKAPVLRIEWLKSRIDNLKQERSLQDAQLDALRDALEDKADLVSKAMRRAWQLGQTYWQQADSEYTSHHRKADETQAKFQTLVDETRAAILADVTPEVSSPLYLHPAPIAEPVAYVTDSGRSAVMVAGANLDDDTPLYIYTQAPPTACGCITLKRGEPKGQENERN